MREKEVDARIKSLAAEVSAGRQAELVEELIETALRLGRDKATIADMKLFNRAMREMRFAASVFTKFQGRRKVAIFGSARTRSDAGEFIQAREFARRIVREGFMVITGGGDGIMGAAQQGAGAENSFGLNIRLPFEQRANETIYGDRKLINFNYFFTRKLNFMKETHAFVLCPGGFGTQDEGFEALTLMQTGKSQIVPLVLLDRPNGHYWETWRRFIHNDLLGAGLVSQSDFHLFRIAQSVDEAVAEVLKFYRVFHSYRWVRERMVIRVNRHLTAAAVAALNDKFDALLAADRIVQTEALPEEHEDAGIAELPRLVLTPHKRDFGMIRLLLDGINESETEGARAAGAENAQQVGQSDAPPASVTEGF
ncbi:MAG: TIGR00730 family Rossman fold protein [Terrimicrobiaceae bacterium]|nr:TIGR00730 family Rossman fold protein [Terrimicrobiaceae bacterium]